MKVLKSGWRGLEEFGINPLTGEADAYSMRLLCDVNELGKKLLEDFFGNTIEIRERSNWNSTVDGKPAVGSIMLHYDLLFPLKVFCLFHVLKCDYVIYGKDGDVNGVGQQEWEKYGDTWQEVGFDYKVNWGKDRLGVSKNGRNIHQMSGRTV